MRIQIGRLVTVAFLQTGGERPSQIFISGKRKQKCAYKLRPGGPYRTGNIALLDRRDIHKDRLRPVKEYIERSSVFQNQPVVEKGFTEIKRQLRGSSPLSRCPFPGVRRKENVRVLQQVLSCAFLFRQDRGPDEPSGVYPLFAGFGLNELQDGIGVFVTQRAQNTAVFNAQRSCRIAEGCNPGNISERSLHHKSAPRLS